MSEPKKILIQLDPDPHASSFDAVVALDAGVEHLLQYGNVASDQVRDLVYGAMFTRGPAELHRTAIFVGGSDVTAAERLTDAVVGTFFGPMRVSVMMDANGANTTAVATVLCIQRHVAAPAEITVLAATGAVGQRVARLLVRLGYTVRVGSRALERAESVVQSISRRDARIDPQRLVPVECAAADQTLHAVQGAQVVVATGAPGVQLLSAEQLNGLSQLQLVADVNAVPPAGIAGVQAGDQGRRLTRTGEPPVISYGALGIGGLKMKLHKSAVRELFARNDQVLDADEILELGQRLQLD